MTYLLTVEPGVRGASVDIYGAWCRAGFSPINCHSAWLLKWAVPLLLPVMGRRLSWSKVRTRASSSREASGRRVQGQDMNFPPRMWP